MYTQYIYINYINCLCFKIYIQHLVLKYFLWGEIGSSLFYVTRVGGG